MTMFHTSRQLIVAPTRSGNQGIVNHLTGWKMASAVFLFCFATALAVSAQTFTTIHNFDEDDGTVPRGLVQGTDGNLYGTTEAGGAYVNGTVFRITSAGALTTLHSFCGSCSWPSAGLVLASDGNFYGTAASGGSDSGTVFKITPEGTLTTLHRFNGIDGADPFGGIMQADDGNFYGTTLYGAIGYGTIFKITPAGVLTTLYSFPSGFEGYSQAALLQANDGNFYLTSSGYGGEPGGTLFKMTTTGGVTILHSFCSGGNCPDGEWPGYGLIQAGNGRIYGSTSSTVFKITLSGVLTTVYTFEGLGPGGLVLATDGNFYGVTGGGFNCFLGCGTVFELTPAGKLTTLHNFDGTDGSAPVGLVQATDGNLYGTTSFGGPDNDGTIFRLSVGLSPFVDFIRASGKVGATVQILGQGFTGTSEVSFNGTPAKFTVQSDTYLTATVPAGAEWGFVTVTTPTAILKSKVPFRVTPQIFSNTPTSGPMGTTVVIQGMSFHRTYAITFGNIKATDYTVDSDTQITATVPTGAQKGKIAVLTPGGTAYSPTCFDVTE